MGSLLGTTTANDILASVGASVGQNVDDFYVIAAAAVAIPLAFYVFHRLIGLFPKARGGR